MLRQFKSDSFVTAIGLTTALATIGFLNSGGYTRWADVGIVQRTTTQTIPQLIAVAIPSAADLIVRAPDRSAAPTSRAIVPITSPIFSATGATGAAPFAAMVMTADNGDKPLRPLFTTEPAQSTLHPVQATGLTGAPMPGIMSIDSTRGLGLEPSRPFAAPKQAGQMQPMQPMYAPLINYLQSLQTCSPNTLQFGALSSQIMGWEGEHCRTESSLIGAGANGVTEAVTCLFSTADLDTLTDQAVLNAAAAQDMAVLQELTQTVQQVAEQACE